MKTYTRGDFRAIGPVTPHPETIPQYRCFDLQARKIKRGPLGEEDEWFTIESFDYASTAKLRVRNLHAACCISVDLVEHVDRFVIGEMAKRYVKTGKLTRPMRVPTPLDLKPCKD